MVELPLNHPLAEFEGAVDMDPEDFVHLLDGRFLKRFLERDPSVN